MSEVSRHCAAATAATAAASSASWAVGEVQLDLMHVQLLGEAAGAAKVAKKMAVATEVVQNGGEAETDLPPTQNYEGEPPQVQPQSSQAWSACSAGTEMGKRALEVRLRITRDAIAAAREEGVDEAVFQHFTNEAAELEVALAATTELAAMAAVADDGTAKGQ